MELRTHIELIGQKVEDLAKFCRRSLPEEVKRTYVRFLIPLSQGEVLECFDAWVFKSTKFPSISELLECVGRSPKQRAERMWPNIEMKRDRIADKVVKDLGLLGVIRTANKLSEFEGGGVRRDAKSQFLQGYEKEWMTWWQQGRIEEGESFLDFSPKPRPQVHIPKEELITPEQLSNLRRKIAEMGGSVEPEEDIPF